MDESAQERDVPAAQKVLDHPFLLLLLGLVVMFGFYTLWGVYELMSLPQGQLP